MWSKGVLQEHTHQALLNTIFLIYGMLFVLQSGSERNLRKTESSTDICC